MLWNWFKVKSCFYILYMHFVTHMQKFLFFEKISFSLLWNMQPKRSTHTGFTIPPHQPCDKTSSPSSSQVRLQRWLQSPLSAHVHDTMLQPRQVYRAYAPRTSLRSHVRQNILAQHRKIPQTAQASWPDDKETHRKWKSWSLMQVP